MNRRDSRHGFETRFAYPLARRYPSRFAFLSLILSAAFTNLH